MTYRITATIRIIIFLLTIAASFSVSAREVDLSKTDQTARFVPVVSDYTVEIYVDKVDGRPTKFRSNDSAIVDAGERTMAIRLEYTPATGTSLILGRRIGRIKHFLSAASKYRWPGLVG